MLAFAFGGWGQDDLFELDSYRQQWQTVPLFVTFGLELLPKKSRSMGPLPVPKGSVQPRLIWRFICLHYSYLETKIPTDDLQLAYSKVLPVLILAVEFRICTGSLFVQSQKLATKAY